MSELIDNDGEVLDQRVERLKTALEAQHAMHGIFGEVFQRLGGTDFLFEWAEENQGRFITLMTKMTPGLAPTQGFQGEVHLHVHNSLTPTALDDNTSDS